MHLPLTSLFQACSPLKVVPGPFPPPNNQIFSWPFSLFLFPHVLRRGSTFSGPPFFDFFSHRAFFPHRPSTVAFFPSQSLLLFSFSDDDFVDFFFPPPPDFFLPLTFFPLFTENLTNRTSPCSSLLSWACGFQHVPAPSSIIVTDGFVPLNERS